MFGIGRTVTFGERLNAGGVSGSAFRIREIERREIVRRGRIVFWMQHQFVERLLPALVIKEDQTDDDIRIGERLDLSIEILERTLVDREITVGVDREQLREIDVQRGVLDAKPEGVIDHLDLEAFSGGGGRKRSGILGERSPKQKGSAEGTK